MLFCCRIGAPAKGVIRLTPVAAAKFLTRMDAGLKEVKCAKSNVQDDQRSLSLAEAALHFSSVGFMV